MRRILLLLAVAWPAQALAEVVFTNGERETIRANEGFYFGAGASALNEARTMEVELSGNFKVGGVSGSNGDVDWRRFPLEALWFYRLEKVRLGGGLTYHVNPKLDGSGVVGGLDLKFKNALGIVLQGDWRFGEHATLGLRYTSIEYEAKGGASGKAKGNGLGVSAGYRF